MRHKGRYRHLVVGCLLVLFSIPFAAKAANKTAIMAVNKTKISVLSKQLAAPPQITSVGIPPLTQGQNIVIGGKGFGTVPGKVTIKGEFSINGLMTTADFTLPIIAGMWTDNMIGAGPIPSDFVGYDQEVSIYVKTKSGAVSNEGKAQFKTQLDYKLYPRSKMQATCWSPGCLPGYDYSTLKMNHCNTYPDVYVTNTATGYHQHNHKDAHMGRDYWKADLKKGWKFYDMQGGSWDGPILDPRSSLVESANSISFNVDFTIPGVGDSYWSDVGYWLNIIVAGPMGMEP